MNFPTTHNKFFGLKSSDFFPVFCEIFWKQFLCHPSDFFFYRLVLSLPSPPSFSRPQTSSSADSWALVFLSVKIVWTLVFVAQALLFELPSRQRHFTLFNKVRARDQLLCAPSSGFEFSRFCI